MTQKQCTLSLAALRWRVEKRDSRPLALLSESRILATRPRRRRPADCRDLRVTTKLQLSRACRSAARRKRLTLCAGARHGAETSLARIGSSSGRMRKRNPERAAADATVRRTPQPEDLILHGNFPASSIQRLRTLDGSSSTASKNGKSRGRSVRAAAGFPPIPAGVAAELGPHHIHASEGHIHARRVRLRTASRIRSRARFTSTTYLGCRPACRGLQKDRRSCAFDRSALPRGTYQPTTAPDESERAATRAGKSPPI